MNEVFSPYIAILWPECVLWIFHLILMIWWLIATKAKVTVTLKSTWRLLISQHKKCSYFCDKCKKSKIAYPHFKLQ